MLINRNIPYMSLIIITMIILLNLQVVLNIIEMVLSAKFDVYVERGKQDIMGDFLAIPGNCNRYFVSLQKSPVSSMLYNQWCNINAIHVIIIIMEIRLIISPTPSEGIDALDVVVYVGKQRPSLPSDCDVSRQKKPCNHFFKSDKGCCGHLSVTLKF